MFLILADFWNAISYQTPSKTAYNSSEQVGAASSNFTQACTIIIQQQQQQ